MIYRITLFVKSNIDGLDIFSCKYQWPEFVSTPFNTLREAKAVYLGLASLNKTKYNWDGHNVFGDGAIEFSTNGKTWEVYEGEYSA